MSFRDDIQSAVNMHFGFGANFTVSVSFKGSDAREVKIVCSSYHDQVEVSGKPTAEQLRIIALSMEER